jgi:RNA polymerase primary sigma factor
VDLHLRRGAPLNGRDGKGRTPLILAAMRGHAEVCRLLLDAGADAALRDDDGRTALEAAQSGKHSRVVALIASGLTAETADAPDHPPISERYDRQPDELPFSMLVLPNSPQFGAQTPSAPFARSNGESAAVISSIVTNSTAAQVITETIPTADDADANQFAKGWAAENEDRNTAEWADSMPIQAAEPVESRIATAAPPVPPAEVSYSKPTAPVPDDPLWEPEPELLLSASEDNIKAAAATFQVGLTRHSVSITDPDWTDTDLDLPGTAPAWTAGFRDGFDAYRAFIHLLEKGLRHGWVPEEDLDVLRANAVNDDKNGAVGDMLRTVLGDLGVLIEDEHALDLSRESYDDSMHDEPAFRRLEAAGAIEFIDGLSGAFPDAERMLLEAVARAPTLSASQEATLFRDLALARQEMLRLVASSHSSIGILLSWADRLEVGLDASRDVSEADWTIRVEVSSTPAQAATVRNVSRDFGGSGEISDELHGPEEDVSAAKALASRLRDVARMIADRGGAVQILSTMALTTHRVLELAESALPPKRRAFRHRATSRDASPDLHLLRRLPKGRQTAQPLNDIGTVLKRYLSLREMIVEANLRRVVWHARRCPSRGAVSFLDLVQEGQIGLLRAIDKYDVNRGWRFGTYATWWIRQSMNRFIQDAGGTIRVPVHMLEFIAKVKRRVEAFKIIHGSEPAPTDIANDMQLDACAVERAFTADVETVPLEAAMEEVAREWDDPAQATRPAPPSIVDPDTPLGAVIHADLRRWLLLALSKLEERSARVIDLRFGISDREPLTLEEVGQLYGLTRERIRQIEAKAMDRLPRYMPSRYFENMAP